MRSRPRRRPSAGSIETDSLEDKLVRFFLDVPDTPENRAFFLQTKDRLKKRFEQVEIWITTFSIEVL